MAEIDGQIAQTGNPEILYRIILPVVFLLFTAAAEVIVNFVSAAGGVVFYFILLLALIVYGSLATDTAQRKLWIALGLVSLIRISSIVMPVVEISPVYWYVIVAVPVLVGIIVVSRNLNYGLDDMGLNLKQPGVQLLTAGAGIALGVADYFILKPEPLAEGPVVQLIFPALILLIFTGLIEELAFRGVMQRAAGVLGRWGWTFIALVYAVLQIGWGSILHGCFVLLVALYFGFVVKRTGSIAGVSMSHGLLNVMLLLVMPNLIR